MSTNSAVKHKVARWRQLFSDAMDYYEKTSLEHAGHPGDPVQNYWGVSYLGTLVNIMRKDMQETSKRLSFFLSSNGTHKDTLDANSFRAAAQAIDNMHAVNGEIQKELLRPEPRQAILPPPQRVIRTDPEADSDPDSWDPEEPTSPSRASGPPVIFGD